MISSESFQNYTPTITVIKLPVDESKIQKVTWNPHSRIKMTRNLLTIFFALLFINFQIGQHYFFEWNSNKIVLNRKYNNFTRILTHFSKRANSKAKIFLLKKPLVYSFCKSLLDKKVKLQIIPCRVLQGLSQKKDWLHARFDTVRWLMKQIETKLSGQPSW